MESKYDTYGVLKSIPWIDIPIGTIVEYIDTKSSSQKSKKTKLTGVWNGEYVAFNDKEKTLVRTTRWLTIVNASSIQPMTKACKVCKYYNEQTYPYNETCINCNAVKNKIKTI